MLIFGLLITRLYPLLDPRSFNLGVFCRCLNNFAEISIMMTVLNERGLSIHFIDEAEADERQ